MGVYCLYGFSTPGTSSLFSWYLAVRLGFVCATTIWDLFDESKRIVKVSGRILLCRLQIALLLHMWAVDFVILNRWIWINKSKVFAPRSWIEIANPRVFNEIFKL